MDEVVAQEKDQVNLEHHYGQHSYRGRQSYNLLTGEDDSYGGHVRGYTAYGKGKKILNNRNKSTIFNGQSNANTNQNTSNDVDQYYQKQFQTHPSIDQSHLSFERNKPSRLKALRLNTGNGVNRDQMREENEKMYAILKTRNQKSNIF